MTIFAFLNFLFKIVNFVCFGQDTIFLFNLHFALRHAHKNTVMEVKWNLNGNWLLTASRDHLCKLFDIRNLKEELQVFRGHKKEATGLLKCFII